MSDPSVHSSIRFPASLRERLEARAAVERRTFSGQVRVLVEHALDAQEVEQAVLLRQLVETFGIVGAERS